MPGKNVLPLALTLFFFFNAPALAYVGPGPGLSMIGSLFALLGGVALALGMVLFYPIRLWLKRRKSGRRDDAS